MSGSLPPLKRRRPRRGSIEHPINGRLYRSGLLVALLPLLFVALTISTPQPLPRPALPGTFDTAAAATLAHELATTFPDRAPGTVGAGDGSPISGATLWFERQLLAYGLHLSTISWSANVPGRGRVRLTDVLAVVNGQSPETIVVMAHRDDLGLGPGANDDASGTAALIELARAYAEPLSAGTRATVESDHTIIFLSTDGDAFGDLGSQHFLATYGDRNEIAAVVNLDAIAGTQPAALDITGDRPLSPNPVLVATAAARIAAQTGQPPQQVGLIGQLIDLGFPYTLDAQGPFIREGVPALTITTTMLRPPPAAEDDVLSTRSLGELGSASQELLGSLDQDIELAPGTATYLWLGGRTVRGWAIELLLVTLILPCVAVVADLFALCRRAQIALSPAARALARRLGFWTFVGAVFTCFCLLGLWPTTVGAPPTLSEPGLSHASAVPLIAFGVLVLLGWSVAHRRLVVRQPISREEALAGYLVGLTALMLTTIVVAATNPFALIFVLPALHVWLWLPQIGRAALRTLLALAALAAPALPLLSLGVRYRLGFDAPWYLLQLAADGYITPLAIAITLAAAAAASQILAAASGRYAPYPALSARAAGGPLAAIIPTLARAARTRRETSL